MWQPEFSRCIAVSCNTCLGGVASLRVDPHVLGLRVALRGVARAWCRPILPLNPWGRNGLLHGCLRYKYHVSTSTDLLTALFKCIIFAGNTAVGSWCRWHLWAKTDRRQSSSCLPSYIPGETYTNHTMLVINADSILTAGEALLTW